MSFSKSINNSIEENIMKFISEVSTRHNIDPNDLLSIWTGDTETKFNKPKQSSELDNLKVSELKTLCKNKGLKLSGTKQELIERLEQADELKKEKVVNEQIPTKPVIKKIIPVTQAVAIKRNQWGNHEHPDTSLIFDKNSKKVIGKQNDNGSIDNLTEDDIDLCNKYKFEYIIPENLDKTTGLKDVIVDELEEEDEEVIESDNDDEDIIEEDDLLEEEEEVDFDEDEDFDYDE